MRALEAGYAGFNEAAMPSLLGERGETNSRRRAADLGALATERELFTFEKLDSLFDTGKVSFVNSRTYFDGQLIDGTNTSF
jgi:hypothetical protein